MPLPKKGLDHGVDYPSAPRQPSRHCAHGANEATRAGVSLGNSIEWFLASTGRGNRRRVGRELQMTENLPDHLGLSDSGNDPERTALANGTGG